MKNKNKHITSGELVKIYKDLGFDVEIKHMRIPSSEQDRIQRMVRLIRASGGTITKELESVILDGVSFSSQLLDVCPKGGYTLVALKKGGKIAAGQATCSIVDNFKKSEGVSRALKRASDVYQRNNVGGSHAGEQ